MHVSGSQRLAAEWAANVRKRNPTLTGTDFFRAFPIKPESLRARVAGALARQGFRGA